MAFERFLVGQVDLPGQTGLAVSQLIGSTEHSTLFDHVHSPAVPVGNERFNTSVNNKKDEAKKSLLTTLNALLESLAITSPLTLLVVTRLGVLGSYCLSKSF